MTNHRFHEQEWEARIVILSERANAREAKDPLTLHYHDHKHGASNLPLGF